MSLSTEDLKRWIHAFADRISEKRQHLTKLDSAIGDGDHGQNMHRGMQAALEKIDDASSAGLVLKGVAMSLIGKTGGASGPLYGTFFMDASKAVPDAEITLDEWATMMRAGLDGVKRRGQAETGDKTMVDALTPAVEALEDAVEDGSRFASALQAAADAAEDGMEATTPMVARKGRASYLGERSRGHQDPGATSTYYLFATAAETLPTSDAS
jgi:dihydroxyacetone kinase-like protein